MTSKRTKALQKKVIGDSNALPPSSKKTKKKKGKR